MVVSATSLYTILYHFILKVGLNDLIYYLYSVIDIVLLVY